MNAEILWTSAQAAEATGGWNTDEWRATGVSINSRDLRPDDLFIALKGPNFDGHDFVDDAFRKGAAAAVSHRQSNDAPRGPVLLVEDTMAALWRMGAFGRSRSSARLIGVTGSVGKTGIKEVLAHCLSAQAQTASSAASFNNHWGVPLSLARMPPDATFGVFELGMNHPGEIRELTQLLKPHVALITNVEAVHIEYFDSVEQIADAKAEIFDGVMPDGTAVLNRDNPHFEHLAGRARAGGVSRIIGFGSDDRAEARPIDCALNATGSRVTARILGRRVDYSVSLPGAHWVINSLAVLATVAAVEADVSAAAEQLGRLTPLKGRGERHHIEFPGGTFLLIDDSYNANPTSMRAAFEVLGRAPIGPRGRRIAVLGDMLELGRQSTNLHAGLSGALREAGIDLVFSCGPDMAALDAALPPTMQGAHVADSQSLTPKVIAGLTDGDAVLVKGSLGSRMGLVVEALKGLARPLARAANDK